ncbi:solute carrier family 7 member genderblind isoform X2 [Xylocopa sonorina]|uniref:solute carrier family 7 member genderblind isoform X2 n=1 Tax=Xylocopa sonorina TaxID=1818115 RepID=UPI00403AEC1D
MVSQIFDESPKEMQLLSSDDESQNHKQTDKKVNNTDKVQMRKQLGLLEGVAIILGIICGSGIFISPKGVITEVGSVGVSLIVWILCGLLSMVGALCYAELGTCIPRSGGDYAYIYEAFGDLPAFLYLWAANLIFVPTTNAIMGLTFAQYVLQPFFPNCSIPDNGTRLLAAVTICLLTFANCYDVKDTSKMQNVFMFAKIGALVIIIITGLVWIMLGHTENFENTFENTIKDPGKLAVAFYSGIFSYSGWNYLNFMTEELKDPYVNLPRAIYISLPLVTLIYVLANVAYLSVLTPTAMIASHAIAVCTLSLIMLCTSDIFVLITYCSIVESFFIMLSVAGILWLRYKRPNMDRPIKMPLWIPITFVAICAFLVFVPCYERPYEVGIGTLITLSGVPAYFVGVKWKNKPLWFQQLNLEITYTVQKLFMSAIEERDY